MKTRINVIVTVCGFCLAHAGVKAATQTGPIINPANGHSYYLLTPNTWTASEAEARTLGGHLATINDAAENQWVFTTFPSLTRSANPNTSLWIGFNDVAVEGQFVWSSGEPVTFTYWFPGEPNNTFGIEDYTTIRPVPSAPPSGSWNDLPNDGGGASGVTFGVVEVVPEPSTYALIGLGALALFALRRGRAT